MLERLQKILSARGIASRRKSEEYIVAGLVKINGKVAKLGDKADPDSDKIEVDGKVLEERKELLYYLMNKPVGVVTSNVERWEEGKTKILSEGQRRAMQRRGGKKAVPQSLQGETTRDILPKELQGKIYPVGRLDKDSGGLLLFTNDGPLAFRLTHPKFDHDKEYVVTVDRAIQDNDLQRMANGMMLDGTITKDLTIDRVSAASFRITLTEGRNRQIRRMCEKLGYRVKGLTRLRIMTLKDAKLKAGEIRVLTDGEKKDLLKAVGL